MDAALFIALLLLQIVKRVVTMTNIPILQLLAFRLQLLAFILKKAACKTTCT